MTSEVINQRKFELKLFVVSDYQQFQNLLYGKLEVIVFRNVKLVVF
jgi:hypothetical protein